MAISSKMSKYLMRILKQKGWNAYDKAAKNMKLLQEGAEEGLEGMAPTISNLPKMKPPVKTMGYNPDATVSSRFGIGENLTNHDVYKMWKRGDISRKEHLMFTKYDPIRLQNIDISMSRRQRIQEKIERIRNNPELSRNFASNLQRNVDENIKKYG